MIGVAGLPACTCYDTWHDVALFSLHINKLGPMIHEHYME